MRFSCTLKNGTVYVPTVAKTEAGFYMNREPVAVVPAANAGGLRIAFKEVMAKGNAIIPTPPRNAYPRPVLLKYSGAKTWSAFIRGASHWSIREKEGNYQIVGYRKDPEGKSWLEDPNQRIPIPPGSTVDEVIERMIAILQEAARQ